MGVRYDSKGICTSCGLPGTGFVSDGVCECLERQEAAERNNTYIPLVRQNGYNYREKVDMLWKAGIDVRNETQSFVDLEFNRVFGRIEGLREALARIAEGGSVRARHEGNCLCHLCAASPGELRSIAADALQSVTERD